MHTYQREPDEECGRSWTSKNWESDQLSGICFLPSGEYKSSHRFPSSEIKQQDQCVKEIATEIKVQNVFYH